MDTKLSIATREGFVKMLKKTLKQDLVKYTVYITVYLVYSRFINKKK